MAALSIGLVAGNIRERRTVATDAIIFTLLLVCLSFISFTTARPQLVGYICVLLFHRLLHRSRENASMRSLWWLPFIMVVWVNTHGSFMAGLTLIGAYGLEALMLKRWDWLKRLFIIGVASALALLCNPYGIGMYLAVSRTLHSVMTPLIMEWLPFVFSSELGTSAWLLVFLLASGLRDASIPIADRIISVIWWVMMLFSMRNSSIFVLVSAPYVAMSLQRWVATLDSIRTVRPDIGEMLAKSGMALKAFAASIIVVIASFAVLPLLKGESYLVSPAYDFRPGIAYFKERYADKHFLTDYSIGGRIIYEARGNPAVFVDGRAGTAYSEELLADYLEFLHLREGWQKLIGKYRIQGIVVPNSHRFATAFANGEYHDQWREVYQDKVMSIYVRK
jgi:hypothetical protein